MVACTNYKPINIGYKASNEVELKLRDLYHGEKGVICVEPRGKYQTNPSEFFIVSEYSNMNNSYLIPFGTIVEGYYTLKQWMGLYKQRADSLSNPCSVDKNTGRIKIIESGVYCFGKFLSFFFFILSIEK